VTAGRLAPAAALLGLAGVALAAAGSHAVPLDASGARSLWSVASLLHLFHAAALLGVAALAEARQSKAVARSGALILVGAVLFSATLYLKALGLEWVPGPLTPLGGVLALAGWAWLVVTLIRKSTN
jgi:uncharacterized membrane protein YgdD (TMEM256/DUF423 family)